MMRNTVLTAGVAENAEEFPSAKLSFFSAFSAPSAVKLSSLFSGVSP